MNEEPRRLLFADILLGIEAIKANGGRPGRHGLFEAHLTRLQILRAALAEIPHKGTPDARAQATVVRMWRARMRARGVLVVEQDA